MSPTATAVVCAGCGRAAPPDEPYPFRCPNAGRDDTDHVMVPVVEPGLTEWPDVGDLNPFVRYRRLLHSYHLAVTNGMADAEYVALVKRLDRAVEQVDGRGFRETHFLPSDLLSERLGFGREGVVWVKDETRNVSGSHKARHLMGLLILLEVAQQTGLAPQAERPGLAIASCGNAALAAAVVARAAGRPLEVFVPTWADPAVLDRLASLGARLTVAPREPGLPGDPTYHRLRAAVADGALPFTCQGPDNGLTIEGGQTLGYEMVSKLRRVGRALDRVFVQVGGGALASAVVRAFRDAEALGALPALPRIHAVQTRGGHPLERAYVRLAGRILERLGEERGLAGTADGAERIRAKAEAPEVQEVLRYAAAHRSEFMWAWEEEPRSVATGILDDETYDWLAVVRGMVDSGGFPVVVSEETLEEANRLGREATGVDADHTGTSGLAGLLALRAGGDVRDDESVAVLFTGVRR